MKQKPYTPVLLMLFAGFGLDNAAAVGVKEWVEPVITIADFSGAWSMTGTAGEYRIISALDQQVFNPHNPEWTGSVSLKGAVNGRFTPFVTEGLGVEGLGAVIVRNAPLYSGGYPEYTLSLYNPQTRGDSSLDIMLDKNTYMTFTAPVSFTYSGTSLVIPETDMYAPEADKKGSVTLSGKMTAPTIALAAGREERLASGGALSAGPDIIDSITILPDGSCSGLVLSGDILLDFQGKAEAGGRTISIKASYGTQTAAFSYRFEFIAKDEFRLLLEMPVEDKKALETAFGFKPGSLEKALHAQMRTYRRPD